MPYEDVTAPEPGATLVTVAEFARLVSVSPNAVYVAIRNERLSHSVVLVDGQKMINVELARQEWAANTRVDFVRRPDNIEAAIARASPAPEPAESLDELPPSQRKQHWDALEAERKFRVAMEQLVPAKDVADALADVLSVARAKLASIPSRAKQEAPDLSIAHVELIDRLVREVCDEMADAIGDMR